MSALELYTLSPYAEYSYTPFFFTISIIAFASLIQIHLMYRAEIDKYSVAFDKRLAALESVTKDLATKEGARDKLLEEHSELYRNNIALHEQVEKSIMLRLAALESVVKDLATTYSAHDKLLEEHGDLYRKDIALHEQLEKSIMSRLAALEGVAKYLAAKEGARDQLLEEHGVEISLAAETAYRAAGLPDTNKPHPAGRSVPFHPRIQYAVDEPIQKFLRTSPKKTVRDILSHLSQDEATQTEWKRSMPLGMTLEITRHDVNSRLYSLLAQGKLKKDNGARPVWSVI
jgi:hypothetical protein